MSPSLSSRRVGRLGLAHEQGLRTGEGLAAAAFDEVTKEGEGRAGEADQGHGRAHAAESESPPARTARSPRDRQLGSNRSTAAASRTGFGDHRTRIEVDLNAHALERRHDVAEEDRGVHAEPPDRLDRHLGGELGRLGQGEEVGLLADLAVLGQVATGLAHDPHRRVRRRLTPAGSEERARHPGCSSVTLANQRAASLAK